MDFLEQLTGSQARADVLAALFLGDPRPWGSRELGRAAQKESAAHEVRWLVQMGILRPTDREHRRSYLLDIADPRVRELSRLVRQARGAVPELRRALLRLSIPVIAWLTRMSSPIAPYPRLGSDLVVLSSAPKSLIQLQLVNVAATDTRVHPMSIPEWTARLRKNELLVRQARRARKLWVVGSWQDLRRLEERDLDSRRTLEAAMADWREELSDEWDEDYDPLEGQERLG